MDSDGHTVVVKNVVLAVGHTSQQMIAQEENNQEENNGEA